MKITLPNNEDHMIVGIWWQHEYQNMYDGYIHNIKNFEYLKPDTTDVWTGINMDAYHDGFNWDASKQGKEKRKEIVYFERPIYTKQVMLRELQFTAKAFNNWFPKGTSTNTFIDQGDYVPFNLGHDIFVQIELYGCPNYELNKRELNKHKTQ
jgi:hypothetical protein